jgi:hypothetical protein
VSRRSIVQYCGDCLGRFGADADRCTECGAAARGLNYKEAQQELLDMLVRESAASTRIRAICAFGQRGEPDRAATLVDIALLAPAGSPDGLAVVQSLTHLLSGTGQTELLLRIAKDHADPEVRMAANRVLLRGR